METNPDSRSPTTVPLMAKADRAEAAAKLLSWAGGLEFGEAFFGEACEGRVGGSSGVEPGGDEKIERFVGAAKPAVFGGKGVGHGSAERRRELRR